MCTLVRTIQSGAPIVRASALKSLSLQVENLSRTASLELERKMPLKRARTRSRCARARMPCRARADGREPGVLGPLDGAGPSSR